MSDCNLRRATPADIDILLPLVRACHEFEQVTLGDAERREALVPLLDDPSPGMVWLIQSGTEVVGYIALCFGYSIEFRGRDAFVDEFYIVPSARGQGIGRAALRETCRQARNIGVRALHLEVANDNARAIRLYTGQGFVDRRRFHLMSLELQPATKG